MPFPGNYSYKDDLGSTAVDLRTLSKAIEDVASLAELFYSNVTRNIRDDNDLAASAMHELAAKVESGASVLHELVELLIHYVTNWPRPTSGNDGVWSSSPEVARAMLERYSKPE